MTKPSLIDRFKADFGFVKQSVKTFVSEVPNMSVINRHKNELETINLKFTKIIDGKEVDVTEQVVDDYNKRSMKIWENHLKGRGLTRSQLTKSNKAFQKQCDWLATF